MLGELSAAGREPQLDILARPADVAIQEHYVDRSVAAYFRQGQQNPVVYVNC
jgi:hypothetical protein